MWDYIAYRLNESSYSQVRGQGTMKQENFFPVNVVNLKLLWNLEKEWFFVFWLFFIFIFIYFFIFGALLCTGLLFSTRWHSDTLFLSETLPNWWRALAGLEWKMLGDRISSTMMSNFDLLKLCKPGVPSEKLTFLF